MTDGGERAIEPPQRAQPRHAGVPRALAVGARIVLVAAAVLVVAVVFRGVDWAQARHHVARLGPRALLVPIPFLFVLTFDTLGWWATFPHAYRVRAGNLFGLWRIRTATEAVGASLPAGAAIGEPLRVLLVERRLGLPLPEATANVVVIKLAGAVAQGVFFVVAIAALRLGSRGQFGGREGDARLAAVGTTAAVIFLGLMIGVLLLLTRVRVLTLALRPLRRRFGATRQARLARLERAVVRIERALAAVGQMGPARLAAILALLWAGWLCLGVECWLILALLQTPVPIGVALSMEAIVSLVRIGSFLLPGGLGAQEASYYGLLSFYGVPHAEVVAAAFVVTKRGKELFWIGLGYLLFLGLPVTLRETVAETAASD